MRNKAKYFSLAVIVIVACVGLLGCAGETPDNPIYTSEQIISEIQVYGVPYTNGYLTVEEQQGIYNNLNSVGQWAATYEGNGQWRVQGAVVSRYQGKDLYGSTTWTYNEKENKITLVAVSCEQPIPPTIPTNATSDGVQSRYHIK